MIERLKELYPALTDQQATKFERFYELLIEWNKTRNLTAITEPDAVAEKHFFDSLAAAPLLKDGANCIDVGTGAGFPGIPLLIIRPDLKMTLMDALQKRVEFLEFALKELDLTATCVHMRAEDAGRSPLYREKFDYTLTRAVSALPVLLELTVPLLKVNGSAIAYKGDAATETETAQNAAKILRCRLETVTLEASYGARTLVIAKKFAETPGKYPRKAGTPAKQPL